MNRGALIIISGSSGAGKSTVIAEVLRREQENLFFSVSCTTRAPRPGEREGVHYRFISHREFEAMLAEDALLEHAKYVGNYYGTPLAPALQQMDAGRDVLLDIEVQGAVQVRAHWPEAISIFVVPPNLTELERRLRMRGTDSEEKIRDRLQMAKQEYAAAPEYDYLVINDTVSSAADEICTILQAERCRMKRRAWLLEQE